MQDHYLNVQIPEESHRGDQYHALEAFNSRLVSVRLLDLVHIYQSVWLYQHEHNYYIMPMIRINNLNPSAHTLPNPSHVIEILLSQ